MTIRVWVCQVRREVFVGGESQRCRHANVTADGVTVRGFCGEMELIGGEPVEWCVVHGASVGYMSGQRRWCWARDDVLEIEDNCQFESQIRVGP